MVPTRVDAADDGVSVEQGGQVRVVGLGGDEPVEGSADVVVAIDGPAGSGKSTVARQVAERAGLRYLDTGATYRALTLALLRRGIPVEDAEAVADAAKAVDLTLELPPGPAGAARVLLDGVEPGPALRTPEVNAAVSVVAAVPAVRELLVGLQRSLVAVGGIVVEGRDIGTVVWPDADVKVFLTASEHERVRRRGGDAGGGGETAETLARRDAIDSGRAASPTRPAADALVIDSTTRSIDQVVDLLLQLIDAARASRPR